MQVLTHFPLLKALGWALFNSLWQMAALWLLYSLLLGIFQNTASKIRHGLALLFLAAGSVWTAVSFCTAWLFPVDATFWQPFFSPAQSVTGRLWQTGRSMVEEVLPYGSAIYLLILAALLIRYFSHYRHARMLTRQGLSAMPPQLRTFVAATALQLGIRKPVKPWLSSLVDVPLTLGFLKPVILLPAAMITHLTPEQVEAILVHELAHIQRKDYLLHLLVTMLEGLFFFNPFARLLIRRLKKERENCCDDMVLQFKYDAHAYVSALLTLAAFHQPVHRLAIAATGTGDRLLLQRAKRILLRQTGERLRPAARPLLLLLFTGLLTALTLYHPMLKVRKPAASATTRANTRYYIRPLSHPLFTLSTNTLAAKRGEIQSQTLFSAAPPVMPRRHDPVRLRITARRPSPPANTDQAFNLTPDGDNVVFINTADDAVSFGEAEGTSGLTVAADDPGGSSTLSPENRDFSLNLPQTIAGPNGTVRQGTPFIPNSSLYFQYNQSDSTHPEEQLRYLQMSGQFEVLGAIEKLQQQTTAQLKVLDNLRAKAAGSVQLRKQIDARQLQLQKDYLMKIETWQRKLQKTTHLRVIVYI